MSREALSLEVLAVRVPPDGKRFEVETTDEQRRAIADALGIDDVAELSADLDLRPLGDSAFALNGSLAATVVQTDVVTLEPVRQDVRETIDLTLVPAEEEPEADEEARVSIDGPERDIYRNGRIDLGAIVLEHLALGLDPYPRSPGVEFSGHLEGSPDAETSPFAALARLKQEPD